MLNVVAIQGRLVADPELRTTPQGTSVCQFRIACERSFARQGEQRQADFIDIVAWRSTAEFVCRHFSKGSMILVEGRIQTRQYQDKNGSNRTAFEVVAGGISFGGKSAEKPSVRDFDQQTKDHEREANAAHSAPQAASGYSQGNADDFAVITDNDDLPF